MPNAKNEDKKQWLEARASGLGGSDAAAALGLSPWKSKLALWAEKAGLIEAPDLSDVERVEWGTILEEPIARKYADVTKRKVHNPGQFAITHHVDHKWQHCTVDRIIEPNEWKTTPGDLSIKAVGFFQRTEWMEEAPVQYQIQLQHELAVTGLAWGSFGVLIGGQEFRWMDVLRNERFISYMTEKEGEFWDMVVRGIRPEPDASDSSREALARLYPTGTDATIELPAELEPMADGRRQLLAMKKQIEDKLQAIDNRLKAEIADSSIGLFPNGGGFSWKQQTRPAHKVAASTFRVLREIKPKKGV